ncbi:MAG TPA: exo-beta-N-acetylmuramidase NamZ domain-containing protein, partial [Verrucomicrobiae bacterium]|nr:exo-beta-N-acetylmuramidase NamZ domain-containing protein [Verrucomicrobiae bacterium]
SRPRGKYFPLGSFGHTGFTGTSLWIDPFSQTFWIFLSNRVHPDGRGNVLPLQAELANLAALSVKGFDFTAVAGALPPRAPKTPKSPPKKQEVLNGIDVLVKEGFKPLRGLKIGLITNHTGRDRNGTPSLDLLHNAPGVSLVSLFSPEHGIRGEIDAHVKDGMDEKTGLPIYSLYGERRSPLPEQLAGLDALVFDIQDIGCRFYTYISTMGNCMEAAANAGVRFIVLDRLNPITGAVVGGPVLAGETDFVGWHTIPVRHGLTVGELARLFNSEKSIGVNLSVVPLAGWTRGLWLDETTIPWINTSPNMRSLTQAALYPGVGLLETTHLSVGRGTETPFELFGAPYIDGETLATRLNGFGIRGVRFDPITFTPDA